MREGSEFATELEASVASVRAELEATNEARELALPLCRAAIRYAANCIRAVHRGEIEQADLLLEQSRAAVHQATSALGAFPQLLGSGFVQDAQKEYAEASITLALIAGRPLPRQDALGVRGAAYLHGLAESIGELRRHLLDALRSGAIERCELLLGEMDAMYSLLVTIDYPDAMTANLRRATDVARSILERTRGDLTLAAQQERLARRLELLGSGPFEGASGGG
ncbi:MAG: haloacid dehalogenase [Chloroflexi bacterium]|nr:haloacid dehalogenase [Chloroflexota bacterium]